ncbi:NAD(P)-dependent oxidoreductase [Actinoplanes sp. HUAS TT8]|uniref:NAD(P)-dependent oxidoreductase n=1 Tax=Actinoplanes sp. HUAS TT8 TaxID=3447453 RepID=UPI003F51E3E2
MEITVLGASGATGLELTRQALERGHSVVAIARTPSKIAIPDSPRLTRVAADVRDPDSIAAALAGRAVVVSGLGIAKGDKPGVLVAGARALAAARSRPDTNARPARSAGVAPGADARPAGAAGGVPGADAQLAGAAGGVPGVGRVVWLGAYGTGPSARAAGVVTRTLLKALGDQLPDKVEADALVLAMGGTVFHAGPLTNGPRAADRRTIGLSEAPKRLFPAMVSRATVAAAMLDEAENPAYAGGIALPAAAPA